MPHKLTDYMAFGLPAIAPNFAIEVAEIVAAAQCGILVDTADPQAIAQALDRLSEDSASRQRLGRNGQQAMLNEFNWEHEAERLIQVYRRLQAR
jgi:glycosyltransferase involved in cell wall biosynthesis